MADPSATPTGPFNYGAILTGISTLFGSVVAFFTMFPSRKSVEQRFEAQREEEKTYRDGVAAALKEVKQDVAGYSERTETALREIRETMKDGFAHVNERIDNRLNGR